MHLNLPVGLSTIDFFFYFQLIIWSPSIFFLLPDLRRLCLFPVFNRTRQYRVNDNETGLQGPASFACYEGSGKTER